MNGITPSNKVSNNSHCKISPSYLFLWDHICLLSRNSKYIFYEELASGASGKEPACQCRRSTRHRFDPLFGKIPGGGHDNPHTSSLAWRIPRTEEPGGLQSIRSQRVRYDWSNLAYTHTWSSLKCFSEFQTQPVYTHGGFMLMYDKTNTIL